MNLFRRKSKRRLTTESESSSSNPLSANIGYTKLEPRRVLSASFVFGTGSLILDSFDAGQDLTFSQQSVEINGTIQDAYVFDVASGSLTGSLSNPLFELESVSGGTNNRLEVATSFFGGQSNANLTLDGATTTGTEIGFTQNSPLLNFNSLQISNFTNVDRSLELNAIGDITASNLTIADSNPSDAITPGADLRIETEGSITINGSVENQIDTSSAGIDLTAEGPNNDVQVFGNIETTAGNISISSDDSAIINSTGSIQSGSTGNVTISAGVDNLAGNSGNEIRMADGAVVDGGAGSVSLSTAAGGDVLLSTVSSAAVGDAITINSDGEIVDNTLSESANLTAANGRINITGASDIGSSDEGDIDIESERLGFNTSGEIHLVDNDFGVTIDTDSTALGGGEIIASNFLTIDADVTVGATTTFVAGNSSNINDDLTLGPDALVQLNSTSSATLSFVAGDDVIFDGGQISTLATAQHAVVLTADNEGAADSDRGSVTNAVGNNDSVVTNQLEITSFDGIGNSTEPFRVNVDQLTASIAGTGDLILDESDAVELVDLSTADGQIVITAGGDVEATSVVSGENEIAEDDSDDISITSTGGSISVSQINSADDLSLVANEVTDNSNGQIVVASDASIVATNQIELADSPGDLLSVAGNASFDAMNVNVGFDQLAAGDPAALNTFLGSVTVNAGTAILVEDDSTTFAGSTQVGDLSAASADNISNVANAVVNVTGHAQLNSPNGVFLGAQANDNVQFSNIGTVSNNVHLELDASTTIDGSSPDASPPVFGSVVSRGTEVTETLFVTSTGSIEQTQGALNATNIGLDAVDHVHLARVSATNQNVAISAGTAAALTDARTIQDLEALAGVLNSEVDSSLGQSISLLHDGTLNISSVDSPLVTVGDSQTVSGLTTTDGSIFIQASADISIQQDILAQSNTQDPQVTLYSSAADATDPGIRFEGGDVTVNGPTNFGVVNTTQATATFFGDDGFVLPGTTEILLVNPDGTADQDIVLEYGSIGEAGYRVGVVWDSQNLPGQPVEVINTFVSDPSVASEAFEDAIFQSNPSTLELIGGNEGGRETISKVESFSRIAIIEHNESPNVFADVTVRNDQNINLFAGSLETVDNSLNEVTQTLRAELDSPISFVPSLPTINPINPIGVRTSPGLPIESATPQESTTLTFDRDVQQFESGEVKWVLVEVPISDLEEIGDEIKLKDPTKVFSNADDAAINDLPDDIGENEVEKIIEAIETDTEAESGYWYKVFKDYSNRDDELFFYHFKTGESQSSDTTPQSDFESSDESESADPENDAESVEPTQYPDSPLLPNRDQGQSSQNSNSAHNELSAGSLMMATLLVRQSRNESQSNNIDSDKTSPDALPETQSGFGRLARLKRKIKHVG